MARPTPWRLTNPWYRNAAVGGRPARRAMGAPIIQKYAAPDPVTPFLDEPQRSLRLTCDDLAHHLFPSRHVLLDAANRGREPLKLFQPVHARSYLLVCELACDKPGLPPVPREQVCEAGFVIRRLVPDVPAEQQPVISALFIERQRLMRQVEYLAPKALAGALPARLDGGAEQQVLEMLKQARQQAGRGRIEDLGRQLAEVGKQISSLIAAPEIRLREEGWLAPVHKDIGAWQPVAAMPQDPGAEVRWPLFALTPDPARRDHTGAGRAIWYGLIPTHTAELAADGSPRFDERSLYQIRCFVRRHKSGCPRTATPGDCHGELIWSAATEGFRLASPYDLDGTSNRPINIRLPDIEAMRAMAERAGPGGAVGVRMESPPGSALKMKGNGFDLPTPRGRGDQVCFFAIPLITLVALFVLNIFLPILLFLFQLWFMLRLKLCIPPGLEIDAGLAAELKLKGPEFEAGFEFEADFELEIGGAVFDNATDAKLALQAELAAGGLLNKGDTLDAATITGLQTGIGDDLDGSVALLLAMGTDFGPDAAPALAGSLPGAAAGLVYFEPEPRP
jgi:hypothetical protein